MFLAIDEVRKKCKNNSMGEASIPTDGLRTHEPPSEIERFSQEARDALAKKGYEIYELTGRSYEEIVQTLPADVRITRDFSKTETGGTPMDTAVDALTKMRSLRTEVAIARSDQVFLPDSDKIEQQERQIDEYSANLSGEVPDAKAIKGDTLDYVELGIAYAEKHNGASLYGKWKDRKHAATRSGLDVGSMPKEGVNPAEISISFMTRWGQNNEGPWAAPLVVPAKTPLPAPIRK